MKIAGRYARQFSRQSFTSLRFVQAGIAGYPNVRTTATLPWNKKITVGKLNYYILVKNIRAFTKKRLWFRLPAKISALRRGKISSESLLEYKCFTDF
jgi:hypothetical protein